MHMKRSLFLAALSLILLARVTVSLPYDTSSNGLINQSGTKSVLPDNMDEYYDSILAEEPDNAFATSAESDESKDSYESLYEEPEDFFITFAEIVYEETSSQSHSVIIF